MIAVTAASGQLGQLVVSNLLKLGHPASQIVAIVRNPEKASNLRGQGVEVRQGDYNSPVSLKNSLVGVSQLLLISSNDIGNRVQQHHHAIEAAKHCGVKSIVYTSLLYADKTPLALAKEHLPTEVEIKASSIPFTVLRNGWYTENYFMGLSAALESGKLYGCASDAVFSTAARNDYAEAAARVLIGNRHSNKTIELAGDFGFTLKELAAAISRIFSKKVEYINLTEANYASALGTVGLPPAFAHVLAETETQAQEGWLKCSDRSLSQILGRPTESLETSLLKIASEMR